MASDSWRSHRADLRRSVAKRVSDPHVIALSLPEMMILRKVLKIRLIVTFTGVVATGILIVGFVFNALL